jgi:hypothetical protein
MDRMGHRFQENLFLADTLWPRAYGARQSRTKASQRAQLFGSGSAGLGNVARGIDGRHRRPPAQGTRGLSFELGSDGHRWA